MCGWRGHVSHICCMGCVKVLSYSETWLRQPPVGQFELTFIERWLLYRGRLQRFSAICGREAGRFREVAA